MDNDQCAVNANVSSFETPMTPLSQASTRRVINLQSLGNMGSSNRQLSTPRSTRYEILKKAKSLSTIDRQSAAASVHKSKSLSDSRWSSTVSTRQSSRTVVEDTKDLKAAVAAPSTLRDHCAGLIALRHPPRTARAKAKGLPCAITAHHPHRIEFEPKRRERRISDESAISGITMGTLLSPQRRGRRVSDESSVSGITMGTMYEPKRRERRVSDESSISALTLGTVQDDSTFASKRRYGRNAQPVRTSSNILGGDFEDDDDGTEDHTDCDLDSFIFSQCHVDEGHDEEGLEQGLEGQSLEESLEGESLKDDGASMANSCVRFRAKEDAPALNKSTHTSSENARSRSDTESRTETLSFPCSLVSDDEASQTEGADSIVPFPTIKDPKHGSTTFDYSSSDDMSLDAMDIFNLNQSKHKRRGQRPQAPQQPYPAPGKGVSYNLPGCMSQSALEIFFDSSTMLDASFEAKGCVSGNTSMNNSSTHLKSSLTSVVPRKQLLGAGNYTIKPGSKQQQQRPQQRAREIFFDSQSNMDFNYFI